jgi:hypothetical protein
MASWWCHLRYWETMIDFYFVCDILVNFRTGIVHDDGTEVMRRAPRQTQTHTTRRTADRRLGRRRSEETARDAERIAERINRANARWWWWRATDERGRWSWRAGAYRGDVAARAREDRGGTRAGQPVDFSRRDHRSLSA